MSSRKLITGLFFILPFMAGAQYLSNLQRFIVDQKKGCTGLQVTITNTNLKPVEGICGPGNPCDITWGDGSTEQIISSSASHNYAQPGTYNLRVLYQSSGFDDITVVVTPSVQPAFDIITCGGNQVEVRVTDTNYDAYIINYNDGSPDVQVPKGSMAVNRHVYATSGNKTISVRGKDVNAADNCVVANKTVQALASLPAPFINELRVISNTQIDFAFTTQPNLLYRLEIATNNNTTFQQLQTIYNSAATTVTNVRANDNFYCFRLGVYDPCNNTIAYSNIICSNRFTVTPQNKQITVAWNTNTTGIGSISIDRDGNNVSNQLNSPFIDLNVVCKTSYCYQLTSNYTNGSLSITTLKCATAFSTDIPTAITNATSVVNTGGVDITWLQDPAFQPIEYQILRKSGNGNFIPYTTTATPQFTDTQYLTEGEFCYQIGYTDVCDNPSATGIEICPVRLRGELTPENFNQLHWSPYSGWNNGVNLYTIEKYSQQGQLLQTFTTGPGTISFMDTEIVASEQVYRYVIKATANTPGLGQAVSNEIVIVKEARLYYPTAFTPDNQGPPENEVFKVFGHFISRFEMQIFNRWGELLYSTNDIDASWDGTYRGKDQPEGTYAFVARLTDLIGQSFTRTGSVVLLRKK